MFASIAALVPQFKITHIKMDLHNVYLTQQNIVYVLFCLDLVRIIMYTS